MCALNAVTACLCGLWQPTFEFKCLQSKPRSNVGKMQLLAIAVESPTRGNHEKHQPRLRKLPIFSADVA
jgi:hypothetical protein